MIEEKIYKNASSMPPGRYQNFDISVEDKIFAKVDGLSLYLVNDYQKLSKEKISRDIYFKPSYFPLSDPSSYTNPSCFEDWIVPTASFIFDVLGNEIVVTKIKQEISLNHYSSSLYEEIEQQIIKLYNSYNFVYFHFSGGIDSITILSFLTKLNLLNKTKLILYENLPDDQQFQNNSFLKLVELIQPLEKDFLAVIKTTVNKINIANLANACEYDIFTSYSTSTIMYKFSDAPHLTGHYGNQSLLHMHILVDSIVLGGKSYSEYQQRATDPSIYSKTHVVEFYKPTTSPIPLSDKHMLARSRAILNKLNPSLHFPLMNNTIALLLRRLNFSQVTFDHLLQVTFAKSIVNENAGCAFDSFLLDDGATGDNLANFEMPTLSINKSLLTINNSLHHNKEGLEWQQHELSLANKNKTLPINTLVSLKAIQHLSYLTSNFKSPDIMFQRTL